MPDSEDPKLSDPALALALYSSTAATAALVALSSAGLVPAVLLERAMGTFEICEAACWKHPALAQHAELIGQMLESARQMTIEHGDGLTGPYPDPPAP